MESAGLYLIGVDAGTTGLKSLLFDLSGNLLGHAYREYRLSHPAPDRVEQDPEDWWSALAATLVELRGAAGVDPETIAGVGISSQGSTVVPMGKDGCPLRPAISWLDQRSAGMEPLPEPDDDEMYAVTGLRPLPGWTGPVLRWLAAHEPDVVRETWKFLLVGDYLVYRLAGEAVTDYSSASRTRMMDLGKMEWSDRILDSLSISESRLPRIEASGTAVGRVSAEAAGATGLSGNTVVVLGGFDQSCSLLGCGAIGPDTAMISLGTATMVGVSLPKPILDPARRVTTSCHVLPDTWTLQAPIFTTGAVLRWWRDNCFPGPAEEAYRRMDELAETVPIGSDGLSVLPQFSGSGSPRWDHRCRGAFVGLRLAHTQAHIIRAILEGVAMEIRTNLGILEELGAGVETVRIVAGGAVSRVWCDIIGDTVGKPSERMQSLETGALGAAMLAGLGAGVFTDPAEAVARMVHPGERAAFSPENHQAYGEVYRRHTMISDRLYGPGPSESGLQARGAKDT